MPFNKKIAFLGKLDSIKIENVDFLSFENINTALMDYDILIFYPNLFYKLTHKNYSYEDYRGGNLKWLKKISDFLFSKKIYLFLQLNLFYYQVDQVYILTILIIYIHPIYSRQYYIL